MKTPILLILLPVLLLGCELPNSERPDFEDLAASGEISAPGIEAVWEIVMLELHEAQLRIDERETSAAAGKFATGWTNYPSPFRFEGERKQVLGQIVPVEDKAGYYRVHMTTRVQRNADSKDPMDLSRAIWQEMEPDDMVTRQLMYRIERHFAP